MNSEIDKLIESFNYKSCIEHKPSENFIKDINIILNEIVLLNTLQNIDIYDILVSCGHNLTWNQEYNLLQEDLNWLKSNDGKKYFFNNINNIKLFNVTEYYILLSFYLKLIELFELQI
tara:strand:+ start:9513 stop:9866 length:354 start_codon:yes stop_codon:yes gene_type:complete